MEITGGCLCRAVRFQISAPPLVTRICWCRLCQYIAAGNATVNTCFAKAAVQFTGILRDYTCTADSGNVMHRRFCPLCGTPVFTESESRPTLMFVRAGTLDDPAVALPSVTIWTSQAPSWACSVADLPRVERQPPPLP